MQADQWKPEKHCSALYDVQKSRVMISPKHKCKYNRLRYNTTFILQASFFHRCWNRTIPRHRTSPVLRRTTAVPLAQVRSAIDSYRSSHHSICKRSQRGFKQGVRICPTLRGTRLHCLSCSVFSPVEGLLCLSVGKNTTVQCDVLTR